MQSYTKSFYEELHSGVKKSAEAIVPLVLELTQAQSVVDVGCGTGTWLSVFQQYGVKHILGIDGEYVNSDLLEIPQEKFLPINLEQPFELDEKFDLVVSLEVAEHLPEEIAESFVNCLVQLGPVVLFSAAIPFQGGVNHVNEQWPDYWMNYFQEQGYVAIDCLRKEAWQNQKIEYWYAQNLLLFVDQKMLEAHDLLRDKLQNTCLNQLSLVHPRKYLEVAHQCEKAVAEAQWQAGAVQQYKEAVEKYEKALQAAVEAANPKNMSLKQLLAALPVVFFNFVLRKLGKNNSLK